MRDPAEIQQLLLDHGRRMLVESDSVLPIMHGVLPDGTPTVVGLDIRARHETLAAMFRAGCVYVCLLYDGYVTHLGSEPHPACGGRGCDACRGTGNVVTQPRQDALVVLTFAPGAPPQPLTQRYRRIERGSYRFEPVEEPPAGGMCDHAYPTGEGRGRVH